MIINRTIHTQLIVCLLILLLFGCAGITAGITQVFLKTIASSLEVHTCEVTGQAFMGLSASLQRQKKLVGASTKVLIVHGLGEP